MDSEEIARARALPLDRVLDQLGAHRDPKDPARNWRIGPSRITVTESRFYDHNAAGALHRMREGNPGGGGAIDLVQYLQDLSFKDAVATLNGYRATAAASKQSNQLAKRSSERPPPMVNLDRTAQVRWYLTTKRAVPESIVDGATASGQVFGDVRGNVVFRLRDMAGSEIGYEVRGTRDMPFHSVYGEKGLFTLPGGPSSRTVALVESGIEALSYRALRGAAVVVSTTGSAIDLPTKLIQQFSARGYEVLAAFNADKAGDRLSDRLSQVSGVKMRRDRPPPELGKDWNDLLRHIRESKEMPTTEQLPAAPHTR